MEEVGERFPAASIVAEPEVTPPRAGIVGAGFIGAVHARAARLAGARIAGVAATSPDRSREAARDLGAERAYVDCFDLFVADTYAAMAGAEPDGLPRFADGVRAARITDAVLRSSSAGGWVDV